MLTRISLLLLLLSAMASSALAIENGAPFPRVNLTEKFSRQPAELDAANLNGVTLIYLDYFGSGTAADFSILAEVNGKAIFTERPDGPKIRTFAIGSAGSFADEDRIPLLVDDAFALPDLLGITQFPYVVSIDCQGNVIGQLYFEPPSDPGDSIQTKGLLEPGKWRFIQESVKRAVDSGACH